MADFYFAVWQKNGRRRVGKSYLVEEVYKDKIVFRAIGSYIKDKDDKT